MSTRGPLHLRNVFPRGRNINSFRFQLTPEIIIYYYVSNVLFIYPHRCSHSVCSSRLKSRGGPFSLRQDSEFRNLISTSLKMVFKAIYFGEIS